MAKQKSAITVTLKIEPPYTSFAVLSFGGGKDGGVALTSKPLSLKNKSVVLVSENGGIEQMTAKEAKRRGITGSKPKEEQKDE